MSHETEAGKSDYTPDLVSLTGKKRKKKRCTDEERKRDAALFGIKIIPKRAASLFPLCPETRQDPEDQSGGECCPHKIVAGTDGAVVPWDKRGETDVAEYQTSPGGTESSSTLPPGQHPHDPVKKDIDPVGFALDRVQTFLAWIDEHRASFEKLRHTDQETAESELSNLRDSTIQGMIYLQRLSELLLAGYTIDPNKRLPESLRRGWFSSCVKRLHGTEPEPQENKPTTE